jgi:8-amino-3,8-dideoxy-alpha-D-manno-octulosonate transaminase
MDAAALTSRATKDIDIVLIVEALNKAGVASFNYWFLNVYHFINQWDHIKELKAAAKLPIHVLGAPQDYKNLYLPKSQEVAGRLISFGIRCKWTNEEVKKLAKKIGGCVEKALAVTEPT